MVPVSESFFSSQNKHELLKLCIYQNKISCHETLTLAADVIRPRPVSLLKHHFDLWPYVEVPSLFFFPSSPFFRSSCRIHAAKYCNMLLGDTPGFPTAAAARFGSTDLQLNESSPSPSMLVPSPSCPPPSACLCFHVSSLGAWCCFIAGKQTLCFHSFLLTLGCVMLFPDTSSSFCLKTDERNAEFIPYLFVHEVMDSKRWISQRHCLRLFSSKLQ